MVFSSPIFLAVFFPLFLLVHLAAGKRARNTVLLLGSLAFYTWGEPKAVFLMLFVIFLNYALAIRFPEADGRRKTRLLIAGVVANLAILAIFKYLDFIIVNLNWLVAFLGAPPIPEAHLALPIGISFYIFQALSYLIDAYRGEVKIQYGLFKFALYISLFPQLIAGPIVRYGFIAGDLDNRAWDSTNVFDGLTRFCIGLAKKVLLADSLGVIADSIFGSPVETIPMAWAWLGAIVYALQIYYDFSGYSDMAIGMGKMFNFHFPENFNYPYAATSLRDFWRRWHMSLTAWLRDYLYIPLGGSRCSSFCHARNILLVLTICGLWHGAAWTFVLWGVYNGVGLVGQHLFRSSFPVIAGRIPPMFGRIFTMIFILVGWVLFRSENLQFCGSYLKTMFLGNAESTFFTFGPVLDNCASISNCLILVIAIICSQPIRWMKLENLRQTTGGQLVILLLFFLAYAFAMTSNYSPFLYFRF